MDAPYFDDSDLSDSYLATRPVAPVGPQLIELTVYRGHELIARDLGMIDIREGVFIVTDIPSVDGSHQHIYQARLYPARPGPGPWQAMQAEIVVNGGVLFGPRKPLVYYAGDPTDWASGIVRWEWPGGPGLRAVDLALTIRRAS